MSDKPATPLPWTVGARGSVWDANGNNVAYHAEDGTRGDAAYIVHACNNYPRLVEALRDMIQPASLLQMERARSLLRELGEL